VGDGVPGGGADLAERGVEACPGVIELAAGRRPERDGLDAVHAGVPEVGGGIDAGEQVLETGCLVGVRVVAGAMHGNGADRRDAPVEAGGYLDVHARVPGLAGEQARDGLPVPGRRDGAAGQGGPGAEDLAEIGHAGCQRLADGRAQEIPSPADGGLADAEERAGDVLGEVLAHQGDDHRHRPEQPDRRGPAARCRDVPDATRDAGGQLGQLPARQSRNSLVPQRLLRGKSGVSTTRDSMAGAVLISSATRRYALIHSHICGNVDNIYDRTSG
jgi:hypothetical protein